MISATNDHTTCHQQKTIIKTIKMIKWSASIASVLIYAAALSLCGAYNKYCVYTKSILDYDFPQIEQPYVKLPQSPKEKRIK